MQISLFWLSISKALSASAYKNSKSKQKALNLNVIGWILLDCSSQELIKINWQLNTKLLNENIVDIDFEDNSMDKIAKIPDTVPIQKLSFRENMINTIEDGAFENLPYLSYLDLSNNVIENITEETFKGPKRSS